MLLKRHYAKPEGWTPNRNTRLPSGALKVPSMDEGAVLNPPPLSHIEVKHTGSTAEQNFSDSLVQNGLETGVFRFENDGTLVLNAKPEPLRYTVKRTPGRWCLHCGERMPDDGDGAAARAHVASEHAGKPSPKASVPGGYEWLTYYECVLDTKQHAKYNKAKFDARHKQKGVKNG